MKTLLLLILCVSASLRLSAAEIPRLEWDPNTESDVIGYTVRWGPASRAYTNSVQITNRLTTRYDLKCFQPGTYFFALTARDSEGLESPFSEEVTWSPTKPSPCEPAAPALRIVIPIESAAAPEGPYDRIEHEITLLADAESRFFRLGPMQISKAEGKNAETQRRRETSSGGTSSGGTSSTSP